MEDHIHIRPLTVQGEQVDHTEAIAAVLLAQHIAVHAEDAHIAVLQGVVVHIDDASVGDIRRHGVTLNTDGQLRAHGDVALHGDQRIILAEHGRGKARRRRGLVQGDGAAFLQRAETVLLLYHDAQCVHQRVDGLAACQRQTAVLLQQMQLLIGAGAAPAAEAAAVQIVGIHLQRVEQTQQHTLLGGADAGFVVAHRRERNAQPFCQLCAGQAQLLPPFTQLFTKTHRHPPRRFSTNSDSILL